MRILAALALVAATACAPKRLTLPDPLDAALPAVDDCAVFEDAALARKLDRRTRSESRGGNAVDLLVDGAEAYARRFDNTRDADLVLVKTFIFTDDETGRAVADLLRERVRAGATVVVQYDLKGSISGAAEALALSGGAPMDALLRDTPLLAALARDGVIVVPTNVPRTARGAKQMLRAQQELAQAAKDDRVAKLALGSALTRFDHEKYWITGKVGPDGAVTLTAILGGMNIASEYAYGGTDRVDAGTGRGGWRDTDIEVRGPVTEDIVRRYFEVLEGNVDAWPAGLDRAKWQVSQPAAGEAEARFVWNQPAWGTRSRVVWLYRELVRATPDTGIVRLASAYFTPGPRLRRPLVKRLAAGGRLAVITNSPESTDMGIVTTASRGAYHHLLDAAPHAALHEWAPQPGRHTFHSKIASFGTCGPVIVGSANLDGLSSLHNSESVLLVRDAGLRAEMDAVFEADLAASRRLTADELAAIPTLTRWSQLGVYFLGWRFLGE